MGLADQIAWIVQCEGNDSRASSQGVSKALNIQGLRNVIDREVAVRQGG
jgi:hypothetical protein